MEDRKEDVLKYWFGQVEESVLPSQHRTHIWFSKEKDLDEEIKHKFSNDLEKAILGEYVSWEATARGALALLIIFDQFSRRIYRDTPLAYAQDHRALDLCLRGIERQFDHEISLMERAFFYFPLMHSENLEIQLTAVRAYKILVDLSFPEVRGVFESFLDHALRRLDIIKRFGRFPHRNVILGRTSSEDELRYLKMEHHKPGESNA